MSSGEFVTVGGGIRLYGVSGGWICRRVQADGSERVQRRSQLDASGWSAADLAALAAWDSAKAAYLADAGL